MRTPHLSPIRAAIAAAFALAALFPGQAAAVPAAQAPPGLSTAYIGQLIKSQGWSLISAVPENLSSANPAKPSAIYGVAQNGTTIMMPELSPVSVPAVRLVYGNWFGNAVPNGELPGANTIWVHGTVANLSTGEVWHSTCDGERVHALQANILAVCDPIDFPVVANTAYAVRTYCGVTGVNLTCPAQVAVSGGTNTMAPNSSEGASPEDATEANTSSIGNGFTVTAYGVAAVLGYTGATPAPSIACMGDSIVAPTGDAGSAHGSEGWCGRIADQTFGINVQWPTVTPKFGHVNVARGSDTMAAFLAVSQSKNRLQLISLATTAIDDYGTNDMNGSNLAAMETNKIAVAKLITSMGLKYITATLLPKTTSTDNWQTVVNQTATGTETERQNFNSWLRDTSASGFVKQAVAATGLPASSFAVFDAAAAVEVNSAGTPTLNGGFWKAAPSCPYSGTVTTAGATGQFTDTNITPTTVNNFRGYTLVMTSGVGAGQNSVVITQTSAKLLTFLPLTGAPSIGDTYKLCTGVYALDGTHPTSVAHAAVAQSFPTGAIK